MHSLKSVSIDTVRQELYIIYCRHHAQRFLYVGSHDDGVIPGPRHSSSSDDAVGEERVTIVPVPRAVPIPL